MALKPTLETLDGLHEEVAKLYVKKDGKFVLDVDDTGIKSALQKERDAREAAEKALKDREASDAAAKADAEKAELERKGDYEKLKANAMAETEKLTKALAEKQGALEEHLKESAAVAALGAAGLKVNRFLLAEIKNALEVVDGAVRVKGDPSSTPDKLLVKLKEDPECAGLFPADANGAGTQTPGGGPVTGFRARHAELSKKETLTSSESIELVKLAGQIESESKP